MNATFLKLPEPSPAVALAVVPAIINAAIEATDTSIAVLEPVGDNPLFPEQFSLVYGNSSFFQLTGAENGAQAGLLEKPDILALFKTVWRDKAPRSKTVQYQRLALSLVLQMNVAPFNGGLVISLNDITRLSHNHEMLELHTTLLEEKSRALETALAGLEAEISRRGELENRLRLQADIDHLSGLANRRSFIEVAESEMLRCRRYKHPLSLVMLDLDHFKRVNDNYGHAAGDAVIVAVSQMCEDLSRSGIDRVGRLGGEEFAVLLPETGVQGAARFAERLRLVIENTPVFCAGQKLTVTASLGLATLGEGAENFLTLLKRADAALYTAKEAGRNRVSAG